MTIHIKLKKPMTKKTDGGLNAARAYASGGRIGYYETGGSPFGPRGGLAVDYSAHEPIPGTRLIDAPVEGPEEEWRPGLSRVPSTDRNGNRVFVPEGETQSGAQWLDRMTGRAWPEFNLVDAAYQVPFGMMMTSGLSGNAPGFTKTALGHAAEMYGKYAPKAIAGLLGLGSALTTGTPAGSQEAEAPGGKNLEATRARIKALEEEAAGFKKEMEEWQERRKKMMPANRAPSDAIIPEGRPRAGQRIDEGYFQADKNYNDAKASYDLLKGKDGTIAQLQKTLDPEWQRQQREADQLKKQQLEQQAANRSFKDKYPDWAANWYLLPPAIAAGTAAIITGGKKWQDRSANAPWHEAVDTAKRGLTLGGEDALSLVPTLKSLAQYNKGYEAEAKAAKAAAEEAANRGWIRKGLSALNPGMAGGIGAALGVETGLLPWQHDLATLGYEKTKDHMTPMDMFMKLGVSPVMSLLTGKGIGAVTKYLTPTSRPPYEDSKGLAGFLNANATAKEIATLRRNLGLTGADLPRITASPADEIATQDILKASQGRTGAGQAGQTALEQVPQRLLAAPIPERPLGGAPRESVPNQASDAPIIPELTPLPGKASEVNAAVKSAAKRKAAERKLADQDEANQAKEAERKSAAARRKAEKKWGNLPEEAAGGAVTDQGADSDKHHSYFQPRDRKTGRWHGGPVYPQHREDTDKGQVYRDGGIAARQYADGGSPDRGRGSITNPYFPPDYGNEPQPHATEEFFRPRTVSRKEGGRTQPEPSQTPGEPTAMREEYPYGKPRFPNIDPRAYTESLQHYAYGNPASESFGAMLPTLGGLAAILTGRGRPGMSVRDDAMAMALNPRMGRSITGGRPERYRDYRYDGPEAENASTGLAARMKRNEVQPTIRPYEAEAPRAANDTPPDGWRVIDGGMRAGGAVAGGIVGDHDGRGDTRDVEVKSGSFVIPAAEVAFLGGGNNPRGMRVLDGVFDKDGSEKLARGGSAQNIPIKISDGEYVLSPEQVARVGGGDVERGHKLLDQMVMQLRKQNIKTLASLPAPAKD